MLAKKTTRNLELSPKFNVTTWTWQIQIKGENLIENHGKRKHQYYKI